ncbi:hypothetical protein ZIOFF_044842 [Zingiber officinale]|uniref:Uncharacterized protein n=1 Tax=Zingiber officinale TaxID=94328 RepID=A0A8J5KXP2_ZINOF|nr:hypothetical protein ZIOFF_044842 [Zingiber officinale]
MEWVEEDPLIHWRVRRQGMGCQWQPFVYFRSFSSRVLFVSAKKIWGTVAMWSTAKKFSARATEKLEPPWTVPCTPHKATVVASNLSYCTPSGHGMPNLQPQGSPYVLAKHAQASRIEIF